jgi:hypothetical protein
MTRKGILLTLTTEPVPNLTVKTDRRNPQSTKCALFERHLMNYCVFCQSREKPKPSTFIYREGGQSHATLPGVSAWSCACKSHLFLTYIREFPTPTGRKIRLVTNRPITFGEAWTDSRSQDFNLSAVELDLDADSKKKSKGQLLPLCQFKITPEKEVHVELYQNPWRLTDVIDWGKK